jgi:hypothetical protein
VALLARRKGVKSPRPLLVLWRVMLLALLLPILVLLLPGVLLGPLSPQLRGVLLRPLLHPVVLLPL